MRFIQVEPKYPSTAAVSVPVGSEEKELGLFEMANLPAERTGVEGIIYISTAQASHAPRIKWYPERPRDGAPCLSVTIAAQPKAFNHHLQPRVFNAAAEQVGAWVALNHSPLLDFWEHGVTWLDDEVDAFKKALKKLP
jgi:hypothetical protein